MNKIVYTKTFIILFISAVVIMISSICYAEGDFSVRMSLSSEGQVREGEIINLSLNISSVNAGEGIDGVSANLSYDEDVFESASIRGNNGWSVGYAPSNGNIVALRSSKVTGASGFLTISLRVRDGVSANSASVVVQDIIASGGAIEYGGTDDIYVSSVSRNIEIVRDIYEEDVDEEGEEEYIPETEEYEEEGYISDTEGYEEETTVQYHERNIPQTNRSIEMIENETPNVESSIELAVENTDNTPKEEAKVPEGLKVTEKVQVAKALEETVSSFNSNSSDSSNNGGFKKNVRIAVTIILITIVLIFGYILIRKASRIIL